MDTKRQMPRRCWRVIRIVVSVCSLYLLPLDSLATEKIVIGLVTAEPLQLFAWAAKDGGYFKKYNLDVDLPIFFGSRKLAQSMISGDLKLAMLGGPPLVNAHLAGARLAMVSGFVNFASYELFAVKEVRRVEDLRGKVVVVSSFGGAADFLTRYILRRHGLVPDKDVKIVQMEGGPAVRLAAMEKGSVHAALLILPYTNQARKLGFNAVSDLSVTGPAFQQIGLVVHKGFASEKREVVLRLLKALLEAAYRLRQDSDFGVQVLVRNMRMDSSDPDQAKDARDAVKLYVSRLDKVPYPNEEGIQTIIDVATLVNPKAKSVKPKELVDASFLSQLEAEGFVKR